MVNFNEHFISFLKIKFLILIYAQYFQHLGEVVSNVVLIFLLAGKISNGKINYYNDIHFCHVYLFNTLINTTFKFMTILTSKHST